MPVTVDLPPAAWKRGKIVNPSDCNNTIQIKVLLFCTAISVAMAGPFSTVARAQPQPIALNSPRAAAIARDYGKMPLSFEPNRGQTDARVQFVARGAGYTIYLSPLSATFALQGGPAVSMNLSGANSQIRMQPQDILRGVTSYMLGNRPNQWPTSLPTYAKTSSQNVYPGIDLVYHGTQGQLEYDFVVAPQADPSKIRLRFEGATPIVDGASGDLVLSPAVRFRKPVLYQETGGIRQPVTGKFVIANNEVSFQAGAYDRNRELVIDPVLVYSSYLGGSTQQSAINAMTVNAFGEIYVTGVTNALDYPTTTGVIEKNCPPGNPNLGANKCGPSSASAAFVSKISADGQSLIYSTYLAGGGAGSSNDQGTGIAVDAGDEAWVVGRTQSNDFPITGDALLSYCNPVAQGFNFSTLQFDGEVSGCIGNDTNSAFLVHLNSTGTAMLYGTFLSGSGDVHPVQIALDAAGNIYVAGSALTANVGPPATVLANDGQFNYPTTASAYQPIVIGGSSYSAFVTELAPDGKSLIYSTMFSGPNQNTYNNALAIGDGKIFIGGYTQDPHLPTTTGALSHTCVGGPTAAGPDTVCINGSPNAYVAEFDPTLSGTASLVFSTYLNGSVSTQGTEASMVNALAADATGNVYAGGQDSYTVAEGFPATSGVLQPACVVATNSGECGSGFVTKLNASGALVWSTFYGSPSTASGNETVSAIALDSLENVYITANASGLGDYVLNNGFQGYAGGVAYITELSSDATKVLFGSFYGGQANVFPTGLVVDTKEHIYVAGYTAGSDLPLVKAYQSTDGGGFNEGFFAKVSLGAGIASQMAANAGGTPQSALVSTAFGTLLSVTVEDTDNNPVQGVQVTFTAPSSGVSGTFANSTNTTQATTDSNGIATATAFTANAQAGGPYNVTASATGLTPVNFSLTNLAKTNPTITWANPAAIAFGSALGSGQLNATANVAGTFVYNPPAGTVLLPGSGQTLSVTFTPSDTVDYSTVTDTVSINIGPASGPANLVVTKTLARNANQIVVVVTIANTGGTAATNVRLTTAKIGATSTTTALPQALGTIAGGEIAQVTVNFSGSAGLSSGTSTITLSGTYTGGGFSSTGRVTLP
jgi:Beta-propeller repeat